MVIGVMIHLERLITSLFRPRQLNPLSMRPTR